MYISSGFGNNSLVFDNGKIFINGESVKKPKFMSSWNVKLTVIDGVLYLNGYEYLLSEKRFKITLRSLFEWVVG